jgi:cell wall-associated NlpC family hydrolase
MKKNKFAAVGAFALAFSLTTCSSISASAETIQLNKETVMVQEPSLLDMITAKQQPDGIVAQQVALVQAEMAKAKAKQELLDSNSEKMNKAIAKLKKYVGSEYGYGETPGYWDCSGLVRWFYLQQGIDLYHSATAESKAGKKVKTPKVGDIVAFHYGSVNWSFHVGIYVGDGKVLHAYNEYRDTVISSVDQVAKENGAWASYTRVAETS